MNRRTRIRRRILAIGFVVSFVVMFFLLRYRLVPIVQEMAVTHVSNEASFAINRAIIRHIREDNIQYDRLVLLEKDVQGRICAIQTNMLEANRLQTEVLELMDEEVLELSEAKIGVPLGNIILPEFFSGHGPKIPVDILSLSTSDAYFVSRFQEAGINQTMHQILLSVTATMSVLTPMGVQSVTAQSEIIVAETVIVGTVPESYFQYDTVR